MAGEFDLNLDAFEDALRRLPDQVGKGAIDGLEKIKVDWVNKAESVAPKDTGNLQDLITGEVRGRGINGFVEVAGNAHSMEGGDHFNYAYYIHENNAGGKNLKRSKNPKAIKKFLDKPAEDNLTKWQRVMNEEIKRSIGEWSE